MWITTITYDVAVLREMDDAEQLAHFTSIQNKKTEIREGSSDNDGLPVDGYSLPGHIDDIPFAQASLLIKRSWSNEAKARLFAEHFDNLDWAIATVEEQP